MEKGGGKCGLLKRVAVAAVGEIVSISSRIPSVGDVVSRCVGEGVSLKSIGGVKSIVGAVSSIRSVEGRRVG